MMKLTAAFVLALVTATAAAAQTTSSPIDLAAFGWGNLDTPQGIETDGNTATVELLFRNLDTGMYRVVALRGSAVCAGAWFNPVSAPFSSATLTQIGPVHKLLVRVYGSAVLTMVSLDTPAC